VKNLTKFIHLTFQDQVLLLQAFIALAVCQARLYASSVAKLQRWATRPGNRGAAADRLTWAIEVVSKKTLGANCLCRALALQRLLSRNGHVSELRIGVERNANQFRAHAWLVCGDQVVIGGSQLERYQLLAAWRAGRWNEK
jgi:hypothetical protein